jgi:hypothetical protein
LDELWDLFPATSRNRSSKLKVAKAWNSTTNKPDASILIESARKWSESSDWKRDGGKYVAGVHIWIQDRKWETEPAAISYKSKHAGIDQPELIAKGF